MKDPYCRCYRIGGLSIQVESEVPISDATFDPKFQPFETDGPGEPAQTVLIRHIFTPFDFEREELGQRVYKRGPWSIYRRGDEWIYVMVAPWLADHESGHVAVLSDDHTRCQTYHAREDAFRRGGLHSLSLMPTDQIILARVLADRRGSYLHSGGAIMDGQGLLFVGHSEAGKSTISRMLEDHMEVLCDDRNIVRLQPDGFWVYGTWSHGEWPVVSASSAPLQAMLFLEQAPENRLLPLGEPGEAVRRLIACLITPHAPADWWHKSLDLVEQLARDVPCYRLRFDKSGRVVDLLRQTLGETGSAREQV